MTGYMLSRSSHAMFWRSLQLGGVQAVYFLRLIILAKLLAPDAFGLLAIAMVTVSAVMTLSNIGMIPALVQKPDATREQHDGAWTVGLLRASAVALVLFFAAPGVARLFGEPLAVPIIQALALRPLFEATASIGVARLTRELQFRPLAIIYFTGAVVDLVVAVSTAKTLGVWALVVGALAGTAVTALLSYMVAPHRPRISFDWNAIAPLVNFGRWILGRGIVALVGTALTQLAVSRQLGTAELGLYFLALRLAFLPLNTVSAVVGAVAFPAFVRLREDAAATARTFAAILSGASLLLVPIYCILLAIEPLVEQALGPRWAGTGPIIRVICIAGITGILGEFIGPLLMGRGAADRAFRLELLQTTTLLAVLLPALAWFGVTGAAIAWLVGNAVAFLMSLLIARRLMPGALRQATRRTASALAAGLAAGAAAFVVVPSLHGLVGVLAAASVGVAVAVTVVVVLDRLVGLDLRELVALLTRRAA